MNLPTAHNKSLQRTLGVPAHFATAKYTTPLMAAEFNSYMPNFIMRKFTIIVLVTSLLIACKEETRITKVVVISPSFEVLREIEAVEELGYLESTWNTLDQLPGFPAPDRQSSFKWYKLDVITNTGKGSSRWLYDPRGYLMKPSKTMEPRYTIKEVDKLNAVLGI